ASSTLFARSRRVGNPLAPRAGVKLAAAQSGKLHCKEIVARRHARSAVADDFFRGAITEHSAKFVPEELRFLENSLRAEVVVAEAVLRPGDAAGDRVDRLVLAAKPCRRARVEKQEFFCMRLDGVYVDGSRSGRADRVAGMREARHFRRDRAAFLQPLGEAAVEHGNGFMAYPAQHPPKARRHGAAAAVVAHHLVAGLEPLLAEPGDEGAALGQRMAAVGAGFRRRQVAIEVREQGSRDMRFAVLLLAELRVAEVVVAVEHAPLRLGCELRCGHQGGVHQTPSSRCSHSWKCASASSIGDWYGPASSSPSSYSARRPRSMRSHRTLSSIAVSRYAACCASTNSRSKSAISSG